MQPAIPPIDDLEDLSATGTMLEGVLRAWVWDISQLSTPDVPTLAEAIDLFARLTAIRKTLIKLSRLSPPPSGGTPAKVNDPTDPTDPTGISPAPSPAIPTDSVPSPQSSALNSDSSDPSPLSTAVSLLPPPLPEVAPIPGAPLDQLRPELTDIAEKLEYISPNSFQPDPVAPSSNPTATDPNTDPPDNNNPTDPTDNNFHSSPFTLHSSPPPLPLDPRAVALNIHPIRHTGKFPDNHPFFDRSQYGSFLHLGPWHRKKPKRFG